MKNFDTLWKNYPDKSKIVALCHNRQDKQSHPFGNYCAILLSECLTKSGINISHYKGNKCWSHTGSKHILLAEDLANGLRVSPPSHFGRMVKVNPQNFQQKLRDKSGVIFFKDYWQRGNEPFESRSGDHIDLWNGSRLTDPFSWARIHMRVGSFGIHSFRDNISDYEDSKEVWFWSLA